MLKRVQSIFHETCETAVLCVYKCVCSSMVYTHYTMLCCQQLIGKWTFEMGMLLTHPVPKDGVYLNFKWLMNSSNKDSVSFLDLAVYRFHTWTPCWLIFTISCHELWKLRLPSQEPMNKKFHGFTAKFIVSSVNHISVGGRTLQWPGEASENMQALPTDFGSLANFY